MYICHIVLILDILKLIHLVRVKNELKEMSKLQRVEDELYLLIFSTDL